MQILAVQTGADFAKLGIVLAKNLVACPQLNLLTVGEPAAFAGHYYMCSHNKPQIEKKLLIYFTLFHFSATDQTKPEV